MPLISLFYVVAISFTLEQMKELSPTNREAGLCAETARNMSIIELIQDKIFSGFRSVATKNKDWLLR